MTDLIDAQEMGDRIARRIVDLGDTAVVPHVLAATGLTDSELVDVVRGRHPLSSLTLYKLAGALHTKPMYLLTGESDGTRIIVCTDVLGER